MLLLMTLDGRLHARRRVENCVGGGGGGGGAGGLGEGTWCGWWSPSPRHQISVGVCVTCRLQQHVLHHVTATRQNELCAPHCVVMRRVTCTVVTDDDGRFVVLSATRLHSIRHRSRAPRPIDVIAHGAPPPIGEPITTQI